MSGFLLAGLAAFLWSLVNIIDKALLERFCKDTGPGALIILSGLFPTVLIPLSFFFADSSINIPLHDALILLFSGVLTVSWIFLYFHALQDDDVSVVAPLMQITPVFALILGSLFLGEMPESLKLLAGGLIVAGSLVLSVERVSGKVKFKLLFLMIGVSLCIALMNVLFKFVTVEETFWVGMFWHSMGIAITGACLYIMHSTYRYQFNEFIKKNWGIGLTLNGANESLTITGDVLFTYAILLAPLALVQTMEAYQPLFVFIIGYFITRFAPTVLKEDISRSALIQNGIGILLIVLGSAWLLSL